MLATFFRLPVYAYMFYLKWCLQHSDKLWNLFLMIEEVPQP